MTSLSHIQTGIEARALAMQGASAHEISERLNLPLAHCEDIVKGCEKHKNEWAEALQK
jgi:hypothetical protein